METEMLERVEQGVVVEDFVHYIHSAGALIEDARIIEIEDVSDEEVKVIVASDHDVNNSGSRDYFNSYAAYTNRYFSSDAWAQYIRLSPSEFKNLVAQIAEAMNEEYHSNYFSANEHAIIGSLVRELQTFIDRYPEETSMFSAHDVHFSTTIKRIYYFPESYVISKYENDVANKYHKSSGNYLADFAAALTGEEVESWRVMRAVGGNSHLDVKAVLLPVGTEKEFKGEYASFFDSNEWKRFVGGSIFSNPEKLATRWNDDFTETVLQSDEYQEFKDQVKNKVENYSWKLRSDDKITEDQYSHMFHSRIAYELLARDYFTAEYLSHLADEARRDKGSRRRR